MSHRPGTTVRPRTTVRLLVAVLAAAAALIGAGGYAVSAFAATDLAQGRTATASSSQSGRPASAGNDGDAATRWCAASSATGQWWQVDLGAEADLSGTEVTWEFARDYRYRIDTSTDGSTWRPASDRSAGAGTAQVRSDTFTARARYVRITVTALPAGTWASFFSFRVYGAGTTPTPSASTPVPSTTPVPAGPEPDPALRARCTGTAPISCHYDLPPGNYNVTVVLGDPARSGVTTVQAEARRVMLASTTTAAGELRRLSFSMNVRQPEGQPTGQGGTGTAGLDLSFGGSAPRLNGIGIAAARPPVLYLAGDSTVCDQPVAPYSGWGQALPQYIGPGLSVANYADSGESSGSFLSNSMLFPTMRPLIRAGDIAMIQFGHNDKTVTEATFATNLRNLVAGVRAQGGSPILVTPPVRRQFTGGRLNSTALHVNGVGADLPATMRRVAAETGTPLVDLTARSRTLVESMGESASAELFLRQATDGVTDNTHFSTYGADRMARLVLDGVREARLAVLLPYLRQP
ncbi:MAG TPA: discoidin domain-containing protein [Actinoplanes sp.]